MKPTVIFVFFVRSFEDVDGRDKPGPPREHARPSATASCLPVFDTTDKENRPE